MSEERICVGSIGGAYGVQGEVRLKSYCAQPEDIAEYGPLFDETGATYRVTLLRPLKGGFAARLSGVASKGPA